MLLLGTKKRPDSIIIANEIEIPRISVFSYLEPTLNFASIATESKEFF